MTSQEGDSGTRHKSVRESRGKVQERPASHRQDTHWHRRLQEMGKTLLYLAKGESRHHADHVEGAEPGAKGHSPGRSSNLTDVNLCYVVNVDGCAKIVTPVDEETRPRAMPPRI